MGWGPSLEVLGEVGGIFLRSIAAGLSPPWLWAWLGQLCTPQLATAAPACGTVQLCPISAPLQVCLCPRLLLEALGHAAVGRLHHSDCGDVCHQLGERLGRAGDSGAREGLGIQGAGDSAWAPKPL